jgi:hypothetical protein
MKPLLLQGGGFSGDGEGREWRRRKEWDGMVAEE